MIGVKMEAVRFIVEGLINSFRMPQTSIYQLTCLAPTKTQVVGMLTNIMGKNERDYYALLDKVQVGIIPVYINSIFNDAWTFKNGSLLELVETYSNTKKFTEVSI